MAKVHINALDHKHKEIGFMNPLLLCMWLASAISLLAIKCLNVGYLLLRVSRARNNVVRSSAGVSSQFDMLTNE